MRRKLEAARKLNNNNKAKEKRQQNKQLQVTPGSNYNVVEVGEHQRHVSRNDQDQDQDQMLEAQVRVQEIGNEPIEQQRNYLNTENTIILVSNTQIETEPNVVDKADQTIDFNRDDFGGHQDPRMSSSISERGERQDEINLYQVVDVEVNRRP